MMIHSSKTGLVARHTAAAIVATFLLFGITSQAAEITVTTVRDVVGPGDGLTSLREAIIIANATIAADTIQLPTGAFPIRLNGSGEDQAATGDFDIRTGDVVIVGLEGHEVRAIAGREIDPSAAPKQESVWDELVAQSTDGHWHA